MLNVDQMVTYFKGLVESIKFQISSAITFGFALALVWIFKEDNLLKISLTILFVFPICIFFCSLFEKGISYFKVKAKKKKHWNSLTQEETDFIQYYINKKTKIRYVIADNGAIKDSGLIHPLIEKDTEPVRLQLSIVA